MSKLFGDMTTEGLSQSEDRLGGFSVLETDIYTGPVKALYAGHSKEGAMNLTVIVDIGGGKEFRETVYISKKPTAEQKEAKKPGDNFFVKDGKKQPLPGFTVMNDLCLITTGKELHEIDTEEKVVKIYDYEAKKEVPTAVQMVTEALGKPVSLGIQKIAEFKQEKNKTTGEYEDTDEVKEVNGIDKVFHPELHLTVAEARAGKTELKDAEFWTAWLTKNKGQTRDKTKGKAGKKAGEGSGSTPPAPSAGGAPPTTRPSLFNKK